MSNRVAKPGANPCGKDSAYRAEQKTLRQLADDRDRAAARIQKTLADAAAGRMPSNGEIQSGLAHVKELLKRAHTLASKELGTGPGGGATCPRTSTGQRP